MTAQNGEQCGNEPERSQKIQIRISPERKKEWKKLCKQNQITLTSLLINAVEGKLQEDERRKVLAFIEKQDNIFAKIENNINQFAKIANTQKMISEMEMKAFNQHLNIITELRKKQTEIFRQIYHLISRDDC